MEENCSPPGSHEAEREGRIQGKGHTLPGHTPVTASSQDPRPTAHAALYSAMMDPVLSMVSHSLITFQIHEALEEGTFYI